MKIEIAQHSYKLDCRRAKYSYIPNIGGMGMIANPMTSEVMPSPEGVLAVPNVSAMMTTI